MIKDLTKFEPVTITRYATGVRVKGKYQKGASTLYNIDANVQPLTGKELNQVPEGDRYKQNKKIITEFFLIDNDILDYNGTKYEIADVEDWSKFCTGHYEARAVRIDNQ